MRTLVFGLMRSLEGEKNSENLVPGQIGPVRLRSMRWAALVDRRAFPQANRVGPINRNCRQRVGRRHHDGVFPNCRSAANR